MVHAYTASGAAIAFLALVASNQGDIRTAFILLWVAMAIDCSDGTLARAARVKEVVPEFDGARLDDIVDYLTYTFVPIAMAHHAGLLPDGNAGLVAGALPLLASTYGFCRTDAKTDDHFFKGFPSYWNIVVLYFFLLDTSPTVNAAILATLAALVFAPMRYSYPSRNPAGRWGTFTLGPVWAVWVLYLMLQLPAVSPAQAWASLYFPAYYIGLSMYLDWTSPRATD